MRHASRRRLAACSASSVLAPALAAAQSWPQKSIKMIVPFAAGGGTDFIARLVAKHLSERLGQQVYVENRGGANGAIGLQALMQSDPDGYTIATSSDTPLVVNPSLYDKLPYQALRDFVPVATMVRFPGMLAAHPSVPARSVAELIALAKAKPGGLAYASAGVGNFSHLAMELFALATGVEAAARAVQGHRPRLAGAARRRRADDVQQRPDAAAERAGRPDAGAGGRRAAARAGAARHADRRRDRAGLRAWRPGSASSPRSRRRRTSSRGSPRRRSRSCAIRR